MQSREDSHSGICFRPDVAHTDRPDDGRTSARAIGLNSLTSPASVVTLEFERTSRHPRTAEPGARRAHCAGHTGKYNWIIVPSAGRQTTDDEQRRPRRLDQRRMLGRRCTRSCSSCPRDGRAHRDKVRYDFRERVGMGRGFGLSRNRPSARRTAPASSRMGAGSFTQLGSARNHKPRGNLVCRFHQRTRHPSDIERTRSKRPARRIHFFRSNSAAYTSADLRRGQRRTTAPSNCS